MLHSANANANANRPAGVRVCVRACAHMFSLPPPSSRTTPPPSPVRRRWFAFVGVRRKNGPRETIKVWFSESVFVSCRPATRAVRACVSYDCVRRRCAPFARRTHHVMCLCFFCPYKCKRTGVRNSTNRTLCGGHEQRTIR